MRYFLPNPTPSPKIIILFCIKYTCFSKIFCTFAAEKDFLIIMAHFMPYPRRDAEILRQLMRYTVEYSKDALQKTALSTTFTTTVFLYWSFRQRNIIKTNDVFQFDINNHKTITIITRSIPYRLNQMIRYYSVLYQKINILPKSLADSQKSITFALKLNLGQ